MSVKPGGKLPPLEIKCTSTDCGNDLHCFQLTQKMLAEGPAGRCRSCGKQLVDWERVYRRDLLDAQYTFEAMRYERIRHHFWHLPFSEYATNYARRKGKAALRHAARNTITKAVGSPTHPAQGRQTPRENKPTANAIHYAQHATASCCRPCLEEWHGIARHQTLTPNQIEYLTELAMRYIETRMPDLSSDPMRVPPRRARSEASKPLDLSYAS